MRVLATFRPTAAATPERTAEHFPEENRVAWELYRSGTARECYLAGERAGGPRAEPVAVYLLEVADLAAAREAVDRLPMVRDGLVEVELVELRPYDAWERLFDEAFLDGED